MSHFVGCVGVYKLVGPSHSLSICLTKAAEAAEEKTLLELGIRNSLDST